MNGDVDDDGGQVSYRIDPAFEEEPRWTKALAIVLAVCLILFIAWSLYAIGAWLLLAAPYSYAHKTPLSFGLAFVFTFLTAGAFYYLREINRKWYLYPPIEIGVSLGLAATAVSQQNNPIVSMIALFAAVRVAVDGINRFSLFVKEGRRRQEIRRAAELARTSAGLIEGAL